MDLFKVSAFIQKNWFLTTIALQLLQNKGERFVYKINAQQGSYVLKISNPEKSQEEMIQDLYIFDAGYKQGFTNIPKLLKTKDKKSVIAYEGSFGFIMEYIEGGHPDNLKEDWEKIAVLTAQLHQIKHCKHITKLTLDSEKKWIQEQAQKLSFGQAYKQLFDELTDFSALPQTFIHTDIGLHNCAKNKEGKIFFLDWDGAGIGSRILDIGFPLISQFISTNCAIHEENLKIFYKTYFKKTTTPVSTKEKQAIFDASLFFALIYVPYGDISKNWEKIKYAVKNKDYLLSLIIN